ncbi:uncharacterized protein METZ01_LOCUS95999 [marine metagenome]|uniref:Uncharacterized protein n=1 Tax=marine metagenome TaxID=408172 RepID=A0A381VS85_9ZZZZ
MPEHSLDFQLADLFTKCFYIVRQIFQYCLIIFADRKFQKYRGIIQVAFEFFECGKGFFES